MRKATSYPEFSGRSGSANLETLHVGREPVGTATRAQRRSRAVRHRPLVPGGQPQRGAARRADRHPVRRRN